MNERGEKKHEKFSQIKRNECEFKQRKMIDCSQRVYRRPSNGTIFIHIPFGLFADAPTNEGKFTEETAPKTRERADGNLESGNEMKKKTENENEKFMQECSAPVFSCMQSSSGIHFPFCCLSFFEREEESKRDMQICIVNQLHRRELLIYFSFLQLPLTVHSSFLSSPVDEKIAFKQTRSRRARARASKRRPKRANISTMTDFFAYSSKKINNFRLFRLIVVYSVISSHLVPFFFSRRSVRLSPLRDAAV